MTARCLLVFPVLLIAYTITADPTCRPSEKNANHVICTADDDNYVMKRGLVSDNEYTVEIILKDCKITDIENEAFHGLPSLKHVDLSKNKLSMLRLGVLHDAKYVTHLNLSYNTLKEVPPGIFDKNPNLLLLDLKGNKIANIQLGVFDPLFKLKHLDLSSNAIMGIRLNPSIFDRNTKITFVDFSRNDMSDTDENLLQSFEALEFLNLDRCMLTKIPEFARKFNLKTMKRLVLSFNKITEIPALDTFVTLYSLEVLNIGWNLLHSVGDHVFKPMRNLKIIVLRNNKLTHISETMFQNMGALTSVDLANNLITFIPVDAFRSTGLKYLNLAGNRFTYLTDNFCLELRNSGVWLQKFYFHQNPWQCKCLLEIYNEVNKFGIQYNSAQYDGAHAVCVSEEFTCKRHEVFNNIYIDLYDKLITNA